MNKTGLKQLKSFLNEKIENFTFKAAPQESRIEVWTKYNNDYIADITPNGELKIKNGYYEAQDDLQMVHKAVMDFKNLYVKKYKMRINEKIYKFNEEYNDIYLIYKSSKSFDDFEYIELCKKCDDKFKSIIKCYKSSYSDKLISHFDKFEYNYNTNYIKCEFDILIEYLEIVKEYWGINK